MSLCQLLEELPDPDQELVTQVDHNLDLKSFTIFNELPVELRLAIWRLTFPKGHHESLCFYDQDYESLIELRPWPESETQHWFPESHSHPLPVSLFVNAESRLETLKWYHVYTPSKSLEHSTLRQPTIYDPVRPICINPDRDTAFISFQEIFPADNCATGWSPYLPNVRPEIKKIKHLEIRNIHRPDNHDEIYGKDYKGLVEGLMEFLLAFEGLHDVQMAECYSCDCGGDNDDEYCEDWIQRIQYRVTRKLIIEMGIHNQPALARQHGMGKELEELRKQGYIIRGESNN